MSDDELAAVVAAYQVLRARANPAPATPTPSRWALNARLPANAAGRFANVNSALSRWARSGRLRD